MTEKIKKLLNTLEKSLSVISKIIELKKSNKNIGFFLNFVCEIPDDLDYDRMGGSIDFFLVNDYGHRIVSGRGCVNLAYIDNLRKKTIYFTKWENIDECASFLLNPPPDFEGGYKAGNKKYSKGIIKEMHNSAIEHIKKYFSDYIIAKAHY